MIKNAVRVQNWLGVRQFSSGGQHNVVRAEGDKTGLNTGLNTQDNPKAMVRFWFGLESIRASCTVAKQAAVCSKETKMGDWGRDEFTKCFAISGERP
jgi:hypothetical protein